MSEPSTPPPPSLPTGDEPFRVYCGDAREVLKSLPAGSVHCCVTSPPYWGLRDCGVPSTVWGGDPLCDHHWVDRRYYREVGASKCSSDAFTKPGPENADRLRRARWREDATCSRCGEWKGCLGLEPTPELYVCHVVEVFREVRRVLRKDGTLWLNLGDSYAGSWGNYNPGRVSHDPTPRSGESTSFARRSNPDQAFMPPNSTVSSPGLKRKDLVGIPWLVALALREDGWYLRSDIIWHKPNGLPESVTDRPTNCHEHIFLLTKSLRYFYDAEAIREPIRGHPESDGQCLYRNPFAKQRQHAPRSFGDLPCVSPS